MNNSEYDILNSLNKQTTCQNKKQKTKKTLFFIRRKLTSTSFSLAKYPAQQPLCSYHSHIEKEIWLLFQMHYVSIFIIEFDSFQSQAINQANWK